MRTIKATWLALFMVFCACYPATRGFGFEGRITTTMTRGGQSNALLYTAGTNFLRVEMTATNWPNPVDILDRNSGELTLLFPNNRSFVRLLAVAENSAATPPGFQPMPGGLPPSVSPQPQPTGMPAMPNPPPPPNIGPTNVPGMPAPPNMPPGVGPQSALAPRTMPATPGMASGMPAMPMMPPPMMEKLDLKDMGQKTNLFGFMCEQYEIKQRGETMEIWATEQLFPFQPYVQNQPHRFGPRMIEEQWGGLLKAKKLFPLLAILKFDNGVERYRFEVAVITPEKICDSDETLFQPPPNYHEIQPLPF